MNLSFTVTIDDLSDGTDPSLVLTDVRKQLAQNLLLPEFATLEVEPNVGVGEPLWFVSVELEVGGDDQTLAEQHVEKLVQDAQLAHLLVPNSITSTPANDQAHAIVLRDNATG